MTLLLLASMAMAADCPRALGTDRLGADLASLESAYEEFDVDGFTIGVDTMIASTPCLDAVVTPDLAARMHRMVGLRSWGSDPGGALLWLGASRQLEPTYTFPATLVAPGHPIQAAYFGLPIESQTRAVPPPKTVELRFDGQPGGRPVGRATLLQIVEQGKVTRSALLLPDDDLPPYDARNPQRTKLFLGAAGAAAVSAAALAVASSAAASFDQPGKSMEQLKRTQTTANTSVVLSAVTLGAAGAFSVAALVTGDP